MTLPAFKEMEVGSAFPESVVSMSDAIHTVTPLVTGNPGSGCASRDHGGHLIPSGKAGVVLGNIREYVLPPLSLPELQNLQGGRTASRSRSGPGDIWPNENEGEWGETTAPETTQARVWGRAFPILSLKWGAQQTVH